MKPGLILICGLMSLRAPGAEPADFRPMVKAAVEKGEKKIVIPPGTYRLAPAGGGKVVWDLQQLKDVEIIAEGVSLVSTKLTRAVAMSGCSGVTLRGLVVDYDPLPFTQGTVIATAGDKGWVDIKLHEGYPKKPYSRIDVIDPATRYRKRGMPFLWGTKGEMRGDDVVRVIREGVGKAASIGDLASLNTGPADGGIPHAFSLENCSGVVLDRVVIHSAPGMGILEFDGEGNTRYLKCKVVPGERPEGAGEDRLLSSSWDAMQTKTVRVGPWIEGCEIKEAGDDSWSVQSSDFQVLKVEGTKVILASRDEYTKGVHKGDRIRASLVSPEGKIVSRRDLSRADAQLPPDVLGKLENAESWSEWKVSPRCIEVILEKELPLKAGDSVFSPDRMGNGFTFLNNRVHSSGRILIKAAGRIEGNTLDTPHALTVCPEVPGSAAAGLDGVIIRKNKILRAGWFCAAPWSASAGAISITASDKPPRLRAAGVFANVVIEDNIIEDCEGPNLVISSVSGLKIRGNRFVRPMKDKPNDTGASYQIPKNAVMWISDCDQVEIGDNPVVDPGPHAGDHVKKVSVTP